MNICNTANTQNFYRGRKYPPRQPHL